MKSWTLNHNRLDGLVAQTCEKKPNNIAVITEDGSKRLTYSVLNDLVLDLSDYISPLIYKKDDNGPLISIMTERNIAMIVAILAILKSGAAYVPVDPNFPPDRHSHIFTNSQSQLLITDQASYEKALKLGVDLPTVIVVDASTGAVIKKKKSLDIQSESAIYPAATKSDMAYILYTSGSTGKPKGVMVHHTGVINNVYWFAKELQVWENSVVLGISTYCFDISVLEMFMPLVYGGTLIIANTATQRDPYRLLDVIAEHGVTVMQATPTTYEMMLATGWTGDKNIDFLVGGEAFRPSLLPLVTHSRSLRNIYGPTETSIWSSCYNFRGVEPQASSTGLLTIPVGTPISEVDFYIVNVEGGSAPFKLAPTHSEGELWIGGIGVFLPNPFGSGMVYRTGDLVKKLEDGNYLFIRRMDDQVKVNGYRIELAEIEVVLGSFPAVEQAVAVVRDGYLVAYVKMRKGETLGPAEVRDLKAFAGRSLTTYMMP
eukprot:gene12877-27158_t